MTPLGTLLLAGTLIPGVVLATARPGLRQTTLLTAWYWMLAAWLLWVASAVALARATTSPEARAQWLYVTAVVSLCPGIAVLGAKRPGSGVWALFILVPLVFVLGWPALTVWRWDGPRLLAVETPVLVGFGLVLVMGTGNYLGTRFGLAAALYAAAVVLLALPVAAHGPGWFHSTWRGVPVTVLAAVPLFLGASLSARRCGPGGAAGDPLDGLWGEFRDRFGIVWSRRLQERLHQEALREGWSAQVGPFGLEWADGVTAEQRSRTRERFEHHLRWLLRRFVEEPWIDARLAGPAEGAADPKAEFPQIPQSRPS